MKALQPEEIQSHKKRRHVTDDHRNNRVLVTTVPFGKVDRRPLDLMEHNGIDYVINPINRKLKEDELAEMIRDFGILIAGTEPITDRVMANAPHLRLISRVGIGLDSVDLPAARHRGVSVSYTPDAPSPAVAELTVGMMTSLLRCTHLSDRAMREGVWRRFMGRRIAESTVGVIGVGRIGKKVIHLLKAYNARILANDIKSDHAFGEKYGITWADKDEIYQNADIITLHLPLTRLTHRMVQREQLRLMKKNAVLINTSRGGMIDESDLEEALTQKWIESAAIDVFEKEPYQGPLIKQERCLLTSHMGSMSEDCRGLMEWEATKEAVRFIKGEPLQGEAPETEYQVQEDFKPLTT